MDEDDFKSFGTEKRHLCFKPKKVSAKKPLCE